MMIAEQLPPGEYECRSLDIEVRKDEKERKVVIWRMEVVGGPENGTKVEKRYYITSQSAADFLKKEFALLKMDVDSSKDILEKRSQLQGILLRVHAQTNVHGYTNLYLKELVTEKSSTPESNGFSADW